MPKLKVRGGFCLEIEDVESEEDAKAAAFEQIGNCLEHLPFEAAFEVKVEQVK